MSSSSNTNLRFKLKVNPAFAANHSKTHDPWATLDEDLGNRESTPVLVGKALQEARMTGKVLLSNVGLHSLPLAMFDLRNELLSKYDYNSKSKDDDDENKMRQLKKHEKAWECYGEEMVTLVDLSNNDLSLLSNEDDDNDRKKDHSDRPSLGVLDERFSRYSSLLTLRIRQCHLKDIPWHIFQDKVKSLKTLDAPGNDFELIPLELLPKSLSDLDLSDNRITSLGEGAIGDVTLPNLTRLNLSNNQIVRLPSLLNCPILKMANLSNNKLEVIPTPFLHSCQGTLTELDLSKNQLTLAMNFTLHSELSILELRLNKLTQVPSINENLVQLGLNHNLISTIEGLYPTLKECNEYGKSQDGDIWFRSQLRDLHLQKNKLTNKLHEPSICVMTKLSYLDVSHNELETLPYYCGYMADLKRITLDGNPFRIIRNALVYGDSGVDMNKLLSSLRNKGASPPGPGYTSNDTGSSGNSGTISQKAIEARSIVRKAMDGVRKLDLSCRGHEEELKWPEIIDALSEKRLLQDGTETTMGACISEFDASNGKLTCIGKEFLQHLTSLETFDVRRNSLRSMPENICEIPLKTIYFMRNSLTSISFHEQFCAKAQMNIIRQTLLHLDLSTNKLEWVPGDMFNLVSLTTLNLSHNQISDLNWGKDQVTGIERGWKHGLLSLRHLDLSNNKIADLGYLPVALSGCKNLHSLHLNNNYLYHIPLELGLLTQLKTIELNGNSQRKIAIRVLTKSCKDILAYLRDRMEPSELSKALEQHEEIKCALLHEYSNEVKDKSVVETLKTSKVEQDVQEKLQDNNPLSSETLDNLKHQMEDITKQLENISITKTKKFELKMSLGTIRSKLNKEERKMKRGSP